MAIETAKNFFRESVREFKRVNWPSREKTIRDTLIVVGMSLFVAAFLGGLDFIFVELMNTFVL